MTASEASLGLVPIPTTVPQGQDHSFATEVARFWRMRKAVRCASALFAEVRRELQREQRLYCAMVTLTYRQVDQQRPEDVSRFVRAARKFLCRGGHQLRYVWVAELQERGALHYHVLLWLPVGVKLPKPDVAGWWPHGSTKIERARKPVGYLTKYVSKVKSKLDDWVSFPKGFRMHGAGGLDPERRERRSHALLPQWAREVSEASSQLRRVVGGFFSRVTGEFFATPFRVLAVRMVPGVGRVVTIRRETFQGAMLLC